MGGPVALASAPVTSCEPESVPVTAAERTDGPEGTLVATTDEHGRVSSRSGATANPDEPFGERDEVGEHDLDQAEDEA